MAGGLVTHQETGKKGGKKGGEERRASEVLSHEIFFFLWGFCFLEQRGGLWNRKEILREGEKGIKLRGERRKGGWCKSREGEKGERAMM